MMMGMPLVLEIRGDSMPVVIKTPSGRSISFVDGTDPQSAVESIKKTFPEAMERKTFKENEQSELKRHEGIVQNREGLHVSYDDTKGNLTGGHGHLMSQEEKKSFPLGNSIPSKQVDKWFKSDSKSAETSLNKILKNRNLNELPDEAKQILYNMTFNLGEDKIKAFEKMWSALGRKDFIEASKQMQDSDWFNQVKSRGVDLVSRMASLGDPSANLPGTKFNDDENELLIPQEKGNNNNEKEIKK